MTGMEERDGVVRYYGNPAGFVQGDKVLIDAIFYKQDLLDYVEKKMGKRPEAMEGILKILCDEGGVPNGLSLRKLGVRIWQLKSDTPFEMRFVTLYGRNERGFGRPRKDEYRVVWQGEVDRFDLEDVWERFARCTPADFDGHCLSVSDVVELTDGEDSRFFYVETETFAEIEFQQ